MDTVSEALFAGTRFALQQNIVVRSGDPRRFVLQRQKLRRFAYHTVQAVPAAVTGSVGNGSL